MNLQQIRSFCEIAKQGLHISAAADVLHISQSGISTQLRDLENEFDSSVAATLKLITFPTMR